MDSYRNRYITKSKLRLNRCCIYTIILLFSLVLIFFQFHDFIVPTQNHHDIGGDWFSVDPYVLPDFPINNSKVLIDCGRNSKDHLTNVITIRSVRHNGLGWMGGTGHLYHFFERIYPMLQEAYENVWGPTALSNMAERSRNSIYIIFEEKFPIDSLGPFGRFILTSILTGGKYEKIYIGYCSKVEFHHNLVLITGLQVEFVIDPRTQIKSKLFMETAADDRSLSYTLSISYGIIFRKQL